jgi:hypothetical protein
MAHYVTQLPAGYAWGCRPRKTIAATVLKSFGITLEQVQAWSCQMVGRGEEPDPVHATPRR